MASLTPHVNDVTTRTQTSECCVLWKVFESKVADSVNARMGRADAMIESRQYFEEHLIPRGNDPLKWWLEHGRHYPLLEKLAQKYLCTTGTSVPSERLFSKAGELVSQKRSRIKPKNINMFLFLNQKYI